MSDALVKTNDWKSGTREQRSISLWLPRMRSADTEYLRKRDIATGRSRDLAISSAYAANAMRIHRDNVVGPNFKLALRPMWKLLGIDPKTGSDWQRMVEAEWEAYANSPTHDADAARNLTWPWLMQTAYLSFLQSGEALGLVKWKPSQGGFNTCLLLIEPERISQPPTEMLTPNTRLGVVTDNDGAEIAYWIRNAHESDIIWNTGINQQKWERVPRSDPVSGRPIVLRIIDRSRPDMRRGISTLVSAITQMKLVEEYDSAEVEGAILQALLAATIYTELPKNEALGTIGAVHADDLSGVSMDAMAAQALAYMEGISGYASEMNLHVNGARVNHLLPGERLELHTPQHSGLSYEAFQAAAVRKIAAAVGTSAEQLSRDFGEMSFASAKMSLGDIWRSFMSRRDMIVRQMGMPFVMAWLEEAIDAGRVPLPTGKAGSIQDYWPMRGAIFARSTFLGAGPPQVEPLKEREAQKAGILANLTTLQEEANQAGMDWEELIAQRQIEEEAVKAAGLTSLADLEKPPKPPGEFGGDDEGGSAPKKKKKSKE